MTTMQYPLEWPSGLPRSTPAKARFKTSFSQARRSLYSELDRLGAEHIVLSMNVEYYERGGVQMPYADRRQPDDAGVAVYFLLEGERMCFASDAWDRVEHNMRAIALTIEAMRGIERWGVNEAKRRAFSGFKALPPAEAALEPSHAATPEPVDWRKILGVPEEFAYLITWDQVESLYRQRVRTSHPDRKGAAGNDETALLNAAREAARKELTNRDNKRNAGR